MSTTKADKALRALAEYVGADLDRTSTASVSTVAKVFGVSRAAVHRAIQSGKLPAEPVLDGDGEVIAYTVKTLDAALVWGHRLLNPKKVTVDG